MSGRREKSIRRADGWTRDEREFEQRVRAFRLRQIRDDEIRRLDGQRKRLAWIGLALVVAAFAILGWL